MYFSALLPLMGRPNDHRVLKTDPQGSLGQTAHREKIASTGAASSVGARKYGRRRDGVRSDVSSAGLDRFTHAFDAAPYELPIRPIRRLRIPLCENRAAGDGPSSLLRRCARLWGHLRGARGQRWACVRRPCGSDQAPAAGDRHRV